MKTTKRITAFVVFLAFFFLPAISQSFNYVTRTGTLGTTYSWIDCSTGSNIVTGDDVSANIAWPFDFQFYDSKYTTSNNLSVSTNGFIRLNGVASASARAATNHTLSSTSTELGQIIALGVFDNNVGDANSWVRSNVSGFAPNRIFTIQYNRLEIDQNDNGYATLQVSFYETTNKVILKFDTDNVNRAGADIGIHSGTSGFFHKWQEVETGTNGTWIEYTLPVEVNATSGSSVAFYSNIKAAYDAINAGTHTGTINIKLHASVTETASAVLNASGTGAASYNSVTLFPTSSDLTVSGALASPLIQLNGADNVTIDGRVNQQGATNLTILNSSTSASARTIELINSAQANYIQYCTIRGAGTSLAFGTITIGASTIGSGNNGNYIQFNHLTSVDATSRPSNLVFIQGVSAFVNNQNFIRNNNFFNFLRLNAESYGILAGTNTSELAITDNSFYQTTNFIPTGSASHGAIRIDNALATGMTITGNFIGGNAALAAGVWTKTNAFNNEFAAIHFNAGATNNSIQNNVIDNFSYANSGAANWHGIRVAGGSVNVGTVTANRIGKAIGTGSIVFTAGATNANFYGVFIDGSGKVNAENNVIGCIRTAASSNDFATNFYGIHKTATAGTISISNNFIGSESTANSIQTSSLATLNSQILYGIHNLGTGSITINQNIVSNLTNSTTETTLASRTRGIFSNAGTNSISGNRVYKLSTVGLSNGANYVNASIVGISLISNVEGNAQEISNNTIFNIETTATGKTEMYGIFYDGPDAVEGVIARNFVRTFVVPANPIGSNASFLHGISLFDGSYIASNNIVFLGDNIDIGCSIWGIWTGTNDAAKVYHNTVYLSGIALSGTSNSYAFRSLNCPSSLDLRNNILWDARTNQSGTVSHYALFLNCSTNVTVNYNNYQFAQEFGRIGTTNYATLSAWRTATGYDANSLEVNPQIVNLGGSLPVDYQTNTQLTGIGIAAVPTDYNGISRVTPTMGAWEFYSNPVEVWINGLKVAEYVRLKLAFDAVNSGTHQGDLTIKFRGNTVETEKAVLNASGTGSANYSHILVVPAREGVTVTGNLNSAMIELNGADNVIFDGRIEGSGTAYQITYTNSSTSTQAATSTFHFLNASANNAIRFSNVVGGATGTSTGTIIFGSSASGSGNNNNVVENNRITSLSNANRPVNTILSIGSSGFPNTANQIVSNSIFDFLNRANNSFGVNIQQHSNATTISGNSFYETTSFAPTTSAEYRIIHIDDSNSNSNVVASNFIGGSAPTATGTFTKTNAASNEFVAIHVNVGSSTPTTINGNVIRNFNYSNAANANWRGIRMAGGSVNAGSIAANTIGSTTGTGSITFTNSTSGGTLFGFDISSASTVLCENNHVSSVTAANSNTANATHVIAFNKSASAGTTTLLNNTIGSLTIANSIQTSSASTSNAQLLYGIHSDGTGAFTANQNTIANLSNATTNTSTSTRGRINGIVVNAGSANTINENVVRNLSIANANSANDFEVAVIGINLTNTIPNRTVTGNQVFSLSNTHGTYAGFVIGIYYRGATTGVNVVNRNFIHSLTATSAAGSLVGILASSGNTTYSNNIIALGNVTNNVVYGFYDVNDLGQTCNLYFNTIFIGGATAGNNSSFALFTGLASGTRNYRNNVLHNVRTRSSGTGLHTAINYATAGVSNLTVNFNTYFVSGTGTVLGIYSGTQMTTLASIRTTIGQDASSLNTNPLFVAGGGTVAANYRVGVTLAGVSGTGIMNDYGMFSRPASAPTMGAWERNVNRWKGNVSTDWGTASNWTGNSVPAPDETIEFDALPERHCIMDQDRSVMNIVNAQGAFRVITNGKTLTVKGAFQFTNGAQVDASSASSKLTFAGATAQNIPSGSLFNDQVFNLEVNNANHLSLNGTLSILGTVSSTLGRIDASTNNTTIIYSGSLPQSIESNVFLNENAHNVTVDNGAGVTVNADFTLNNNLIINASKRLIVSAAKTLRVNGTVSNFAGTEGVLIRASSVQPNASLIFFNTESNPIQATVEMYSRSTWDLSRPSGSRYNWQFFGPPIRTSNAWQTFPLIPDTATGIASDPVNQGFVRRQNEAGNSTTYWLQLFNDNINRAYNDSSLIPFVGYEQCYQTTRTFAFKGELVNRSFVSGQLAKTTGAFYPGQHILSNPYTAAIDIRQLDFGSDMEKTIYLYNTGTYNQWLSSNTKLGATPGQYVSIPYNLAGISGLPLQIPSMSSMLVRVNTSTPNAYLNIPYSAVIMGNNEMQRVRSNQRTNIEDNLISMNITVEGATKADNMWVFVSELFTKSFDNGYDGRKVTATGMPRLFAQGPDFSYNINSVDDMHDMILSFRAAEDTVYTLTFLNKYTDLKYDSIYLLDTKLDSLTNITETGSTYTFKAFNTTTTEQRFRIIAHATNSGITTPVINVMDQSSSLFFAQITQKDAHVKIADVSGRLIFNGRIDNRRLKDLALEKHGVYIVSITSQGKTYNHKMVMN